MTTKPTLYVAIDGPLVTYGGSHTDENGQSLAPYAKSFVHWAKNHFNLCLITERALRDAVHISDKLELPRDAAAVRGYVDSKLSAVQGPRDFYWVDSDLIPEEINWLAQHGKSDRFLPVVPTQGVTPEHKKYLESKITRR